MSAVDDYLNGVNPEHRAVLQRIRELVQGLVPEAEESISYAMPTFKYKGKPLIYFASFKNHMSIFPTPGPAAALQDKLAGFKVAKGTIQFTLDHPLPESLIKEIIRERLAGIRKP